jgi:hypothetical protein
MNSTVNLVLSQCEITSPVAAVLLPGNVGQGNIIAILAAKHADLLIVYNKSLIFHLKNVLVVHSS